MFAAAKRTFGMNREMEAKFNAETGSVDLFLIVNVVEDDGDAIEGREITTTDAHKAGLEAELGEELGFQVFWRPEDAEKAREQDREFGDILKLKQGRTTFGRIAAQTAKQVLLQRVRDAERDLIFNEYKDRKGELIRGIVRRFEKGNNIVVDIGKTEGVLSFREQTPRETYRPGDRIVAYVKDIDREARGPQVILSRSDPRLVEKLFEAEVPEIYEGIVRIVSVAREPGARSKIAVTSRDADVDPGRRVRRHERVPRASRCAGAARREDRHRAVRPRSGALRHRRDSAGRGPQGHRGRGRWAHGACGPRRKAQLGDRSKGPKRAARLPAHQLEVGHHQRDEDLPAQAWDEPRSRSQPRSRPTSKRPWPRRCSSSAGARSAYPIWRNNACAIEGWRGDAYEASFLALHSLVDSLA